MTHSRYWTPAEEAIVRQHYPHQRTADLCKLQPSAVIPNATSLNALREAVLGEWWAWEAQLGAVRVEIAGGGA